jgi:uncharacterized membrane protein
MRPRRVAPTQAVYVCRLPRALAFGSRGSPSEPTPIEILRRRYAAGEISAAEFEQAKRALA